MPEIVGTLNDQAQAVLRERILSGAIPAGSRIIEVDLASELGIGRGTLRSALQQLATEHLVVQNRFRSTYVASATSTDVFETYTLRNALESLACRLAAENISPAGEQKLRDIVSVMETGVVGNDRGAVVDADYALHRAIIELAGHKRLSEHYSLIEAQTRLFLNLTAISGYDLPVILERHRELVDAIISGDSDGAAALGGSHNTEDGRRMTQTLREQEETAR